MIYESPLFRRLVQEVVLKTVAAAELSKVAMVADQKLLSAVDQERKSIGKGRNDQRLSEPVIDT